MQLAALSIDGATFVRKGRGGDGGVECFAIRSDHSEIGWQTKYVFQWDSSLSGQLDESIEATLRKHPRLVEYVVCLHTPHAASRLGDGCPQTVCLEDS